MTHTFKKPKGRKSSKNIGPQIKGRNFRIRKALFSVILAFLAFSCGKSIYVPAADKDTDEARKEGAILALNSDNFSEASKQLEPLWQKEQSNEIAQLYAVSLLGESGFSLFDIVKKALTSVTSESAKNSAAGNAILEKISSVVGDEVTEEQYAKIKKAVDILAAAPDQSNAGLVFQKCLTAGIYAAPTLSSLSSKVTQLNSTLNSMPTKLATTGSSCGASTAEISEFGTELTELIPTSAPISSNA